MAKEKAYAPVKFHFYALSYMETKCLHYADISNAFWVW